MITIARRRTVVISYSRKDQKLKEQLAAQLRVLEQFGQLTLWTEEDISPGEARNAQIDDALSGAAMVLVLISPAYLSSSHLLDEELPRIIEERRRRDLWVIPIILRSCLWREHPLLAGLSPLPLTGVPLAQFGGPRRDAIIEEIATRLSRLADSPATPQEAELSAEASAPADCAKTDVRPQGAPVRSAGKSSAIGSRSGLRVSVQVAGRLALLGTAIGFTLEITQASALLYLTGFVVLIGLAVGWCLRGLFNATEFFAMPSKASALPSGTTAGALTPGAIVGTSAIALVVASGLAIGAGEIVAAASGRRSGFGSAVSPAIAATASFTSAGYELPGPAPDASSESGVASEPGPSPSRQESGGKAAFQSPSAAWSAPRMVCRGAGEGCANDSQCCVAKGLKCVSGICGGCDRGTCSPAQPCCNNAACVDGYCGCRSIGMPCTTHENCCNKLCDGSQCVTCSAARCRTTADCCAGLMCIGGSCTCGPAGARCTSDTECCGDGTCVNGSCSR